MAFSLRAHAIEAVVLDIEGTTTPLAFVHDVLFPFARADLRRYLRDHIRSNDAGEAVGRLRLEWRDERERGEAPPPSTDQQTLTSVDDVAAYAEWLMDRDRKSPGLKALQGLIWKSGYDAGALRGVVFADVPPALARWRDAGLMRAIYSSGSVLAQKLLFGSTSYGDLTTLISSFFDTGVGPKTESDSYRHIATELGVATGHILFVSDTRRELEAAEHAGCRVLLCRREREAASSNDDMISITRFDEILP